MRLNLLQVVNQPRNGRRDLQRGRSMFYQGGLIISRRWAGLDWRQAATSLHWWLRICSYGEWNGHHIINQRRRLNTHSNNWHSNNNHKQYLCSSTYSPLDWYGSFTSSRLAGQETRRTLNREFFPRYWDFHRVLTFVLEQKPKSLKLLDQCSQLLDLRIFTHSFIQISDSPRPPLHCACHPFPATTIKCTSCLCLARLWQVVNTQGARVSIQFQGLLLRGYQHMYLFF